MLNKWNNDFGDVRRLDESQACKELAKAIIDLNKEVARKIAEEALAQRFDSRRLINEGLQDGLRIIGKKFSESEIFISDLINAGEVAKVVMAILLPSLSTSEAESMKRGRVVIGTVKGDLHDIGKNIVITLLTASGFEVYDLGVDVDVPKFLEKAKEVQSSIIATCALFTTALPYQKDVINFLVDAGVRDKYYIIVGGGAVTPQWAKEIKADGYGKTAEDAVKLCEKILREKRKPPLQETVCVGV